MKNVIAAIVMVILVLFIGYVIVKPEIEDDRIKSVLEWNDVFDITCSCGQHIHAEPCDLKHYKFECVNCGKIHEKDWDIKKFLFNLLIQCLATPNIPMGGTHYINPKSKRLSNKAR